MTSPDLDPLRAALLADAALLQDLGDCEDAAAFVVRAQAAAAALGIAVAPDALADALDEDPPGLMRPAPLLATPPGEGWFPRRILPIQGQHAIEWIWLGNRPFSEPFFEETGRAAQRLPLNRLMRCYTRLADLQPTAAQPAAFIFHMSRCGSTLVAQMIAADRANTVVSEPGPLDIVVMLCVQGHATVALLKAMVQAYCRRRTVLKLDTWHTLALPLFRSAFPSVPWLYLYREPGEVLASRMRQEGTQSLPQPFEHMLPGLGPGEVLTQEEHCARVLARTCEAAAASAAGRLLVNYSELPDAVLETILPHFGLDTLVPGRVRAAARFDAKAPSKSFAADSRAKQEALTGSLGSIAAREVGPAYRRLEALRTGALAAGVPD